MIALAPQVRIFLHRRPTDMRKSFHGLVALTESVLKRDPLSGDMFVFVNRRRDRIKILYWGQTGFCIWYQQLQRGTYQLPSQESLDESDSLELTRSRLSLILDGIDLSSARQRIRFQSKEKSNNDGLRVRKVEPSSTIRFLWDGRNYLTETDDAGAVQVAYTLNPRTYGNLISQRRGGSEFFHFDGLGSTANISTQDESVPESFIYDAFGNLLSGNSYHPSFLYVGELGYFYDRLLSDYYVRARYYVPLIGRWLSEDPLNDMRNFENLYPYAYVNNNPLNLRDPNGEEPTIDNSCTPDEKSAIQAAHQLAVERLTRNPECFNRMRNASETCRSKLHECITEALNRMTIRCAFIGQGKCHDGRPLPEGVTESGCSRLKSDAASGYIYYTPPEREPCVPCKHPNPNANDCTLCGNEGGLFGDLSAGQHPITTWLCRSQPGRRIVLDPTSLAEVLVHEASHNCVGGHHTTNIEALGGKQDQCGRPDSASIEDAFKMCE